VPSDLSPAELLPLPKPPVAVMADMGNPDVATASPGLATGIPKLKPGMTRREVEGLLGPPPAEHVQPVVVREGRLTYHTAYQLTEPDIPATIQVIPWLGRPSTTPRPGFLLTLEYDATRAGHPLLGIGYVDPMF
jgi:hypothetical protein